MKGSESVDAFMASLDHPFKKEIQNVREAITDVDPRIEEEIKWNSPGFRTSDSFATVNLRMRDAVQLIFHFGAKVKALPAEGVSIDDPSGRMKWRAKDRCLVTLGTGMELEASLADLKQIVRQWIRQLDAIDQTNSAELS